MNKSELVDTVASGAGVERRQAEHVLQSFFDTLTSETRSGGTVRWPGFGAFSTSRRAARKGRNPRTGEEVKIKATTVMRFAPSSTLKEVLNSRGGTKRTAKKTAPANRSTASRAPAKKAATAKKAPGAKKAAAAKKAPATKAPAKKVAVRR